MRHKYYTCDSCGAKLPQKQRLSVWVGRRTDAAGDVADEYEHVDLCFDCLRSVSEELLKDMPKTAKQEILRKWRRAVTKEADKKWSVRWTSIGPGVYTAVPVEEADPGNSGTEEEGADRDA